MYTFTINTTNIEETLELSWEVYFSVLGKYIPATRYEPEEYPEVEITHVNLIEANCFVASDLNKPIVRIPVNLTASFNNGNLGEYLYQEFSWTLPSSDKLEALCWEELENIDRNNMEDYYG
jgi:hypothetical protein